MDEHPCTVRVILHVESKLFLQVLPPWVAWLVFEGSVASPGLFLSILLPCPSLDSVSTSLQPEICAVGGVPRWQNLADSSKPVTLALLIMLSGPLPALLYFL